LLRKPVNAVALYETHCAPCHQKDGQGVENIYPPLVGSEWVNGKSEKIVSILLLGLQGEIQVKNKTYNQIMPSYSFLSNRELATLINYVRSDLFENHGVPITAKEVSEIRQRPKKR
jgi:mono/diheme cytochrome c family protein